MKQILIITAITSIMLIVLVSGCSSSNTNTPTPTVTTTALSTPTTTPISNGFVGMWNSNFNQMTVTGNGNIITGTYAFRNGTINGTVSGNTLTGMWTQSYTDRANSTSGDFVFTLSSDGQSFTGKWRYGHSTDPNAQWDGSWTGTKVK